MGMFFFLSTLLFKPPLFLLPFSFFLILGLGAHRRSLTRSLTSHPQPPVFGVGETPLWPQQGLKPWEKRGEAGAPGGAGAGGGAGGPRQVAQGSLGPEPVLGVGEESSGRRTRPGRKHVSILVQRHWGRCECRGRVLKGLKPEPCARRGSSHMTLAVCLPSGTLVKAGAPAPVARKAYRK